LYNGKENRSGIMGLFFGEYDQNTALEVAREESYDRGRLEGKLEGKLEGRQEGYKNTAKNLLSMGLPIKDIAKATGLSQGEIEKL